MIRMENYTPQKKNAAQSRWENVHSTEKSKFNIGPNTAVSQAALCGFIAGDGCLTIRPQGNAFHHELRFYPDDKEMLNKYCDLIENLFSKKVQIKEKKGFHAVRITSKPLVRHVNKLAKFGTKNWTLPRQLFEYPGAKEAWLKAFFSAEAYVSPKIIKVQTVNKPGMKEVSQLLISLGIENSYYEFKPKKPNYSPVAIIHIRSETARRSYLDKIGFWHSKKTKALKKAIFLKGDNFLQK